MQLRAGNQQVKNKLVNHNMRLVVYIAKKYAGAFDPDDLISIGSIGLLKAINSFNPDKGIHFATYAGKCIENEILMALRSNKKNASTISLYQPIGQDKDGNEITIMELIASDEDLAKRVEDSQMAELLISIMKKALTQREYEIICMRYGIDGREALPQREIAEKYNISRSYISRIEKKALTKLKCYMIENNVEF